MNKTKKYSNDPKLSLLKTVSTQFAELHFLQFLKSQCQLRFLLQGVFFILSSIFLSSCMTGSLVDSTLPQTGASGKLKLEYLEGMPKEANQNAFKRHLTRGYYSEQDTVRILLITEPYLKSVSQQWAKVEAQKNNSTPEQMEQSQHYMNQKNIKELVYDKTCFDFELNSNAEKAGQVDAWSGIVQENKTRKEVKLDFKFSADYIERNRGGWFQFSGVACTAEKLDPKNGLTVTLHPLYRDPKNITFTWSY